MKKIICLAIIILGMSFVLSCAKDGDSQDSIVGSWKVVETNITGYMGFDVGDVWKFEANGTLSIIGRPYQYHYDKNAEVIKLSTGEEGETGEVWVLTLSSKNLKISMDPYGYNYAEFYRVY